MNIKSIPLNFPCPKDCVCQDRVTLRQWYHKDCGTCSSIDINGNIFCQKKGCNQYFIKDAKFRCSKGKNGETWYQYKSLSDQLIAISCALQSAEFSIQNAHDLNEFSKNLLNAISAGWYK